MGLYGNNLRHLAERCLLHVDIQPAVYVTLRWMFTILANEYDNQGTTTTRYNAVTEGLQQPLLSLLTADDESAEIILNRLNNVCRAFHELMETDLS